MSSDVGSHDRWDELAVGHALGALEPDEEETFLAHEARCPRCATSVAEAGEVVAELAYAVHAVEPPPALRAAIRAIPEAPEASAGEEPRVATPSDAPSEPTPPEPTPLEPSPPEPVAPRTRRDRRTAWLAAAAAVLVALGGLAGWGLGRRTSPERLTVTVAERAVLACVTTAGCRVVRLAPPEGGAPLATALVSAGRVRVVIARLPANPPDTVYVLWQQQGPGMVPVDAFDVAGRDVVIDAGRLPRPLEPQEALAISHEHGRNVPTRPSEPVAIGTVTT